MSSAEELQRIAMALRKHSRYFKGWNINGLQAFIRDGGCCVYCGKPLLEKYGVASAADHLLPKSEYPELAEEPTNLVPACADCNHLKHYYDPSDGKGKEFVITDEVRLNLIVKAKEDLDRKKEAGDWEKEFQTATLRFREAVAQYRGCKEDVA